MCLPNCQDCVCRHHFMSLRTPRHSVPHQLYQCSSHGIPVQEAMLSPCCDKLYITEVLAEFPADVFFPPVDTSVFRPVE